MKFCTSNYQSPEILAKVQEIRYYIGSFGQAIENAQGIYADKTILIEIPKINDMSKYGVTLEMLIAAIRDIDNVYADFYDLTDLISVGKMLNRNGKYLYHFPATTYAMLRILSYYNVHSIVLSEDFMFDLADVKKRVGDIKLRVNPTLGPSQFLVEIPGSHINSGWILPQHISLYEKYIDILDLIDENVIREQTIVNVYTCGEPYNLPMSLLIKNCGTDISAGIIDEKLVERRLNCKHKCLNSKETSCHACFNYVLLIKAIETRAKKNEESQ